MFNLMMHLLRCGAGVFLLSSLTILIHTLRSSDGANIEGPSGALGALDFWTASRAYPAADIPPDRHARAFLSLHTLRKERSAFVSPPDPWVSIGPTNFAGRTISIAINPLNPNTIYVGAAAGGLWRSRTGGLGGDWQRVNTGFPVLGVNAIAIHAADTGTIYVGTGELYRYNGSTGGIVIRTTRGSYGMGILKTTDNGLSWALSLDWTYNQQRGVQGIRINPLNPRTVFAATSEGVYRSTNAGTTWVRVLDVLLAQDIAIHPSDTTLILATCGNFGSAGTGVYRSANGGASFSVIPGLPSYSGKGMLEMYASNPWSVYASLADSTTGTGTLWKSTNFGVTWSLLSSEAVYGVQGWYSQFVAVHPTDSTRIIRGGQNIYKSTNGGVSSFNISGGWADYHNYAHHPENPDILYIVDDGGVWRSTDFGDAFQEVNTGFLTSQFYNGFSCSTQDSNRALGHVQDHFGWMYVGSPVWPTGGVDETGWTAINQTNDMVMYAGNRGGGSMYKSTNRGVSFFSSSSGITGGVSAWHAPFVLSTSNPNQLYFGRSIVFRSTNAGTSWAATNGGSPLNGNPALSMAVAPTSHDTVFVGTVPGSGAIRLFRTTNSGATWSNVTGSLPNRYPLDIAVDPRDSRIVYVAFGGFDTTRLAKSTDAGLTWAHIANALPNVPTTAVAIDPFNTSHVYVGNDLGVFVSTDAGTSWTQYNDGLFEAVIVADLVVSQSNTSIRLATHSNGVFTRKLLSSLPTNVQEGGANIPREAVLHQNFPNPFNPATIIPYTLSKRAHVTLTMYDIAGREVAILVDRVKESGNHSVEFNAGEFSSGVYVYRLQVRGNVIETRKALLLR